MRVPTKKEQMMISRGDVFIKDDSPHVDDSLFNKDAVMTATQIEHDKSKLIADLENYHPYFVIKQIEGYEQSKQRFLDTRIETAADFYFAAAEYMAVFKDIHTRAVSPFLRLSFVKDLFGYADNGKWMIHANGKEKKAAELYAINGHSFNNVKQNLMRYFPIENDNTYALWLSKILSSEFLKKAGVEFGDSITLTYNNTDNTVFDITYKVAEQTDNSDLSVDTKCFEATIINDILDIKVRSFLDDGSYDTALKAIKTAVKRGIKKVIIDVRDNTGGNDGYAMEILDALGFDFSDMGFTIRYSEATAEYKGTAHKSGFKTVQKFKYRSKNKNGIELKVFCNELTASASMAVVNQCLYSDLGEVIGRTPCQNSNFCGNILQFQLANSKVIYTIPLSYSYFERDGQKVPDVVEVDIEVPTEENYIDFVKWQK